MPAIIASSATFPDHGNSAWQKPVQTGSARITGGMWTPSIIRVVPDVLEAYEIFLRELVGAGNSVIVPTPAYMPFLSVPKLYDVNVIEIEMLQSGERRNRRGAMGVRLRRLSNARLRPDAMRSCSATRTTRSAKVLTLEEELRLSDLAAQYDVTYFQ